MRDSELKAFFLEKLAKKFLCSIHSDLLNRISQRVDQPDDSVLCIRFSFQSPCPQKMVPWHIASSLYLNPSIDRTGSSSISNDTTWPNSYDFRSSSGFGVFLKLFALGQTLHFLSGLALSMFKSLTIEVVFLIFSIPQCPSL